MGVLDLFSLKDRKAYVTGGGQGIGRGFALALAEAGADVAIVDINMETSRKVVEEIKALGRDSLAIKADVTVKSEVQKMVDAVVKRFGRLDIAVNNAGCVTTATAEDLTEEEWDKVVDTNLKGVFLCAQAAGRVMIKQRKGKIINTASMSGSIVNHPQPQAHYNASKAGVIQLTKSLASEWAKYGINVNSISPGYTLTPLVAAEQFRDLRETWKSLTPMGRLGEVDDLRGAVVFLASDASDFMTGHDLIIDGGYTVW
ncbi:MAG: SDR family oxidoreductase [bacterium]